jgi:hypothetical protein
MQSLSPVLVTDGEDNHETEMPALVRSIPSQNADKRETDPVLCCYVVVLIDGTSPLLSSSLSTQEVSTGLSTEMLERP